MIFVGIKQTCVCRDKTRLLSRQKYACRDQTFVATKLWLRFCRDKHTFVTTKDVFRDKSKLVMIKVIMFVPTNIYREKSFVVTKICLLRQDTFLATKDVFCRDKHMFVLKCVCLDKNHTCGSSRQRYSTGHSACVPRAHAASLN